MARQEKKKYEWISASEGSKFAEVVNEFTENIYALGPNPMKGNASVESF